MRANGPGRHHEVVYRGASGEELVRTGVHRAGKLRQRDTTIGISPAQIQERLQALLRDCMYWIENAVS